MAGVWIYRWKKRKRTGQMDPYGNNTFAITDTKIDQKTFDRKYRETIKRQVNLFWRARFHPERSRGKEKKNITDKIPLHPFYCTLPVTHTLYKASFRHDHRHIKEYYASSCRLCVKESEKVATASSFFFVKTKLWRFSCSVHTVSLNAQFPFKHFNVTPRVVIWVSHPCQTPV